MGLIGTELLVLLPLGFVVAYPVWVILKRIGLSPWLSLLAIVPGVNIVLLYYVAFALWPAES
jgi:hypothetical protein